MTGELKCSRCEKEIPLAKRPMLSPVRKPLCSDCLNRTKADKAKSQRVRTTR